MNPSAGVNPRPSGVVWLGGVPRHWTAKRLKYCVTLCKEKASGHGSELPYIGLEHIESWTGRRIAGTEKIETDGEVIQFKSGDVLFGKLRPYLAKAYRANEEGVCTGELLDLRPREVHRDFLFYYLLSRDFISVVDSSTYGAKMPRASWDFIGSLPLLLPPSDEQRAIAAFLDRETARIDALIAKKQRQIELLQEKRAALVTQAVTKGLNPKAPMKDSGIEWLGDVPKHWHPRKLGYVAQMIGGCTPSKANEEYWSGSIPWVSPKDMKRRLIADSEDHISEAAIRETSLRLIDPPVVLIVVRGMILAHTFPIALTTTPVTVNQDMKALRPNAGLSAQYLAYLLEGISNVMLSHVEDSAHGTKCLRTELWKNITVFMPEPSEQGEVCTTLDEYSRSTEQLVEKVRRSIEGLQEYRTAVITAAVTGKIDVREGAA
ncbi:MAG TPA: restriction endonuclease subunit S [Planctomycetota bacterium]|nr:restriction endonuclease subunit S [Planctomycetota bacterium]